MTIATIDSKNNPGSFIQELTKRDMTTAKISRKAIREVSQQMKTTEARFLVDNYYVAQRERIRLDNQIRAMNLDGEPNLVLAFLSNQALLREELLKKALDEFTLHHPVGAWMRTIHGIGPVTAAGLLAHIDINKAQTAGAIWKFAGIDGETVWKTGEKRPWNASLKTLCYKIGEGFVKTSGNEKSVYGQLYKNRKLQEIEKNKRGDFSDQAKAQLAGKNYRDGTVTRAALEKGMLSDANIHARARRYAVKIFLSHLHEVMYITLLGRRPPNPFAIAILGHAHKLEVPNAGEIRSFVEPVEVIEDSDTDKLDLA